MRRNIPLLPFWLSLVVILIGLALPYESAEAARKKSKKRYSSASYKSKKKFAYKKRGRRSSTPCNPALGKSQAIDMLRTTSGSLSRLAGLESDLEAPAPAQDDRVIAEVSDKRSPLYSLQKVSVTDMPAEGEDLEELEAEDDVTVDIAQFRSLYLSFMDGGDDSEAGKMIAAGVERKAVMDAIMDWIGTRYHFGGTTRGGIDCSAFTRTVFAQAGAMVLPRTAAMQFEYGKQIRSIDNLEFGDLVFFHTRRHAWVSHVGIYLGDNLFAHASSRYGVTISSLESTYYNKRFIGAKRMSTRDIDRLVSAGIQAPADRN